MNVLLELSCKNRGYKLNIIKKLERWLDNCKLHNKIFILHVFCMVIPILITDGVVFGMMLHTQNLKQQHAMENEVNSIEYSFYGMIENAESYTGKLFDNSVLEELLNTKYNSDYDYVVAYQKFLEATFFENTIGNEKNLVTVYTDNETIIEGGGFKKMSNIKDTKWYQKVCNSPDERIIFLDNESRQNKVLFLRKLNYFGKSSCEKIISIEFNCESLAKKLESMKFNNNLYLYTDKGLIATNDHNLQPDDFEMLKEKVASSTKKEFELYGEKIYLSIINNEEDSVKKWIREKILLIMFLIGINMLLPTLMVKGINKSFTKRLELLTDAMEKVDQDEIVPIEEEEYGEDEIGSLMQNYNRMTKRLNELIQRVYKDRIKEHENNIARQRAELLALHIQINPHFLFNALESIRMHSLIREEHETAHMVEKLAVIERQSIDFSNDAIAIQKEIELVEAYLELQKYRFGDKLSFDIEMDPACEKIEIPKLTIVTFIENACIHGIEKKSNAGWIFLRISEKAQRVTIEIEDTGIGLSEEEVEWLLVTMRNADISMLQKKGRIGIVNACLRLKMMMKEVEFFVESEVGVGTTVQISFLTK